MQPTACMGCHDCRLLTHPHCIWVPISPSVLRVPRMLHQHTAHSMYCVLCSRHGTRCTQQAYDQHLNMILGDVEETITTVEIDDETYEEIIKVCRLHELLRMCAEPCRTR